MWGVIEENVTFWISKLQNQRHGKYWSQRHRWTAQPIITAGHTSLLVLAYGYLLDTPTVENVPKQLLHVSVSSLKEDFCSLYFVEVTFLYDKSNVWPQTWVHFLHCELPRHFWLSWKSKNLEEFVDLKKI